MVVPFMAVPIMLIIVIERGVGRTRTKRRVREDEKDRQIEREKGR